MQILQCMCRESAAWALLGTRKRFTGAAGRCSRTPHRRCWALEKAAQALETLRRLCWALKNATRALLGARKRCHPYARAVCASTGRTFSQSF